MSRVWLARHRELSTPVVLKTLIDASEDGMARLRNEARLMARIPSPRVVRAVDLGVHEGTPFLVEEYVDGLDLAEFDRRRRLSLSRGLPLWFVCSVVRSMADALQSAHQTGVLHRDVKPSNFFGSPQTGMRLGDFGIATARRAAGEHASGTPRFMPPEALLGEPSTRRADVYSLGATAFDLFYGTPPFQNIDEILHGGPVVFPRARSPEEAYFQHVLARMLERDPERRTPSVKIPRRHLDPLARSLRPHLRGVHAGDGGVQVGQLRIRCRLGDIADAEADGIVNSAHERLQMQTGGGAALRRRAGTELEEEAMRGGKRALGECVVTSGFGLKCKHVIHAVSAWNEASCIARASQRALLTAEELGLNTLAIPALGTGGARVTREASAYATISALHWHVLLGGSRLSEVDFVLFDKETLDVFTEELFGMFLGDGEPGDQDERRDPAFEATLDLSDLTRREGQGHSSES